MSPLTLKIIKFENHFKQLAVPFKNYSDFESTLKWIKSHDRDNDASYTEKYQHHIPYKVVCIDDKFSKPVVLYRRKNAVNKFIEKFLKGMITAKKKKKLKKSF